MIDINKMGYMNTCNMYKALCQAILNSSIKSKGKAFDFNYWRKLYSFLKAFTHAEAEVTDNEVMAKVEDITTVIKLIDEDLTRKDITKHLIDIIENEKNIDRLYNMAQYIIKSELTDLCSGTSYLVNCNADGPSKKGKVFRCQL